MKVYSIIVTYNGDKWIDKCLSSLEQFSIHEHRIVVIDNGSTDRTLSIVENQFPFVELVKSSDNIGFGKANNVGFAKAISDGADYVFILNQDAWVTPGTVDRLVYVASQNHSFGIVSPLHLTGKGDRLDASFTNCISPKICPDLASDALLGRPLRDVYETKALIGAAWLMSRRVIEVVGGFDPLFFHYGEDNNYIQRAIYHGLKVGVDPIAKIHHDREDRVSNYLYDSRKYLISSLIKYADVNVDGPIKLVKELRLLKIRRFISYFQRGNEKQYVKDMYNVLNSYRPAIEESWKENRNPGIHYILGNNM